MLFFLEGGLTLLHVCAILMEICNSLEETTISHVTVGYNFNDFIRREGKRQSGRQMVQPSCLFQALHQTWDIAFLLSDKVSWVCCNPRHFPEYEEDSVYARCFLQACDEARKRRIRVITPSLTDFRKDDGVHLLAETCSQGP